MKAPVVIYYLALFAFAGSLAYFFVALGQGLEQQFEATEKAVLQQIQISQRKSVVE